MLNSKIRNYSELWQICGCCKVLKDRTVLQQMCGYCPVMPGIILAEYVDTLTEMYGYCTVRSGPLLNSGRCVDAVKKGHAIKDRRKSELWQMYECLP